MREMQQFHNEKNKYQQKRQKRKQNCIGTEYMNI